MMARGLHFLYDVDDSSRMTCLRITNLNGMYHGIRSRPLQPHIFLLSLVHEQVSDKHSDKYIDAGRWFGLTRKHDLGARMLCGTLGVARSVHLFIP